MSAEPAALLALSGVCAGYGPTPVLRDVSLRISPGEVVALLGANGAGKTTTLKVVSGLVRPSGGTVLFGGVEVTGLPVHRRAQLGMCHIPEGRGIFKQLTVRENLLSQLAGAGDLSRALELVGEAFPILVERLGQPAGTLSGGQQQMLALSRAYLAEPRLILVDEASFGLAPVLVDQVFEFLARVVAQRQSALLLVDQFAERALALATRAYVMRRGQIVHEGPAASLAGHEVFAAYLGGQVHQPDDRADREGSRS